MVPVKAEHKGDLPGLVHDISSTGATLFVEPMGVVQANNEFIELQAKEQKEIDRILAEFSAEAAAHREDIQWDYDTLVHLDLIFARGQLSYKMNAVRPEVRRDGAIHLRKARHPLLDPKTAVPIDIELGDTFDTPGHHRPQHRRQDRDAQDPGSADADDPVRPPHPGGGPQRRVRL